MSVSTNNILFNIYTFTITIKITKTNCILHKNNENEQKTTNNTLTNTLTSLLISHILGEYAKMVATVSLLTSTFKGITLKLIFKT